MNPLLIIKGVQLGISALKIIKSIRQNHAAKSSQLRLDRNGQPEVDSNHLKTLEYRSRKRL